MDRIESTAVQNISKVQNTPQNKPVSETFRGKLEEIRQENIREELKILYDKIEAISSRLKEKLFIEDLLEYKRTVREFLNITINNSHIFYKENSLDRRGRHRVYSLVKKVDNELDELTRDFLNIEKNRIKILKRLDDIRGMLIDILT
ncbi:MAG TPA: YaaR family protein [Tissierellia bacterium]|nr:YaaR family protein [Tissierellia bacterium]